MSRFSMEVVPEIDDPLSRAHGLRDGYISELVDGVRPSHRLVRLLLANMVSQPSVLRRSSPAFILISRTRQGWWCAW